MMKYGDSTETKIAEVVDACKRYGSSAIIALAGVPGTGKSYVASIAAQRFTEEPLLVREVQFHQSFSYEEFIEGMRLDNSGAAVVFPGIFLELNSIASQDPAQNYLLLIEELTRANISAVLGELLTYVEHRDRPFLTIYGRQPVRIAKNLTFLATYNPCDKSAIELDSAILRRLRIIQFPPSPEQLAEMLQTSRLNKPVVSRLQKLFRTCKSEHPEDYDSLMPFGHGIFAGVENEQPDLHQLWCQRIVHFLRRPLQEPHPFTGTIEANYPWRDPGHLEPSGVE